MAMLCASQLTSQTSKTSETLVTAETENKNDLGESQAVKVCIEPQEPQTALLDGFRKMDEVFTAVGISWRDSTLSFPHFTTLMKQPLLIGGIRIDFKFEGQDWRARVQVCSKADGGTDLVVSMPQPHDYVVPTSLQDRVSVQTLTSQMPGIGRFASLFFQGSDQPVVADVSTARTTSGLEIVCWCENIAVRFVTKFGFKLHC